ncbi:MAG: threonine ammonia-lyase, biosynthetic [Lentisphaeraceae bacterium]|nr:threonine ammonia-lyase, biosynthetic [Lentisphaeraceae bacterium]
MSLQSIYIKKILNAKVYDLAVQTPLTRAAKLSARFEDEVYIKREDLQPVFSFKVRGAFNKMRQLRDEEKAKGVVCASAGNHAQGVALAANHLGIKATIVMPTTTPEIKVESVRSMGGNVVLHGDTFDLACAHAFELQKQEGMTFIHPYDDPEVIAGQGTVGVELMQQLSTLPDYVFVPVGGGGLAAGVSAYVKYLSPATKVIAVESEDSACLALALEKGERRILPEVGIFADGVAVAQIGEETFKLAKEFIDEVVTVSTDEICASIKDLFEDTRAIAEPAGALATAGMKKFIKQNSVKNKTIVSINSGANTSFGRLRHISERTELGSNKEALFAVSIAEKAGSFLSFCESMDDANITEFNYRFKKSTEAQIFVGVELRSGVEDKKRLLSSFKKSGYTTLDLTDNEMAKLHVRYMVGGHADGIHERLFRVQFPEKPGALLKFLKALGDEWSITLFHYRNHAAAYGRVLLGVQASSDDKELTKKLAEIGYVFSEETENLAYKTFLS